MGVHRKATEKTQEKIPQKSFSRKTITEIVSMVVHTKRFEKRNAKLKNLFSQEYLIHKNLTQRSYQRGTQKK